MLRNVAIDNFIHFRERQYLTFKDGANYIIGGNCTGKSSIFELIRRCLSIKESTSQSSIPNIGQQAYVLCKFDLPESFRREIVWSEFTDPLPDVLYSGIFVTESHGGEKKMYKIVSICSKQLGVPFVDVWILKDEGRQLPLDATESCRIADTNVMTSISDCLKNIIEKQGDASDSEKLFQILNMQVSQKHNTDDKTSCEKVLEILTETFAVTFPLRSIGPLQWNKSTKIDIKKREDNYEEAAEKAEILNALVDSEDIDPELEKRVFSTLTSPLTYKFRKTKHGRVECNDSTFGLLKTPEGILEAKQFALILAHKKYLTVCLEEPDHGMHPQMIEKMRNLVLRTYKDKIIILTSHHPSMLGNWTLDRTHVCRRNIGQDDQVAHNIIKVVKESKALLQDEMRNFLFASTVLFVEGRDDNFVLSLLFDEVLGRTPENTHLKEAISRIQILNSQGFNNYTKYSKLAKMMQVPYMFLFDSDVPYKRKPKSEDRTHYRNQLMLIWNEDDMEKRKEMIQKAVSDSEALKPLEQFYTEKNIMQNIEKHLEENIFQQRNVTQERMETIFGLDREPNDSTEEVITKFESVNVFFWKSGDLEDMICKSILQSEMKEKDKKDLLFDLFLLQGDNITDNNKKKRKSALLHLDADKASMLTRCLVGSKEIKRLFKFIEKAV